MAKTPEEEHPQKVYFGWAARDNSGVLSPFNFSRRANDDNDITLDVLYCGICRSDLHYIKNDWNNSVYPLVPGHEIVGVVTEVGSSVTKFKVGDKAAQGGMVASCRSCDSCTQNLENYCSKMVLINNEYIDGTKGYGGFSNKVVIDEHFAVKLPNNMPLDAVAPLLCAGSGAYGALKNYGLDKPEMHLGVVGLGGIGHFAVKFAKAFGAKVTVISTSIGKKEYAIGRLGANEFLGSNDPGQMQAAMGTLDGIIDTVPVKHPLLPLICLLKTGGKIVKLGMIVDEPHLPVIPLILGRKLIGGSAPVGMKETQEMIDFAAKHNITADIEVIPMDYVNTAFERLAKGDVKCRFVVDVGNTLKSL